MHAPSSPLADTTAAAAVGAATYGTLTLNEWAAVAAIIAALMSVADRFGMLPKRRRENRPGCEGCPGAE